MISRDITQSMLSTHFTTGPGIPFLLNVWQFLRFNSIRFYWVICREQSPWGQLHDRDRPVSKGERASEPYSAYLTRRLLEKRYTFPSPNPNITYSSVNCQELC